MTPETLLTMIPVIVVAVIGYFIKRAIDNSDKRDERLSKKMDKFEEVIMDSQRSQLKQFTEISGELLYIKKDLDQCVESVNKVTKLTYELDGVKKQIKDLELSNYN